MKVSAPATNHGAGLDDLTTVDRVAAEATLRRWVSSTSPKPLGGPRSRGALEAQPEFKDVMKKLGL